MNNSNEIKPIDGFMTIATIVLVCYVIVSLFIQYNMIEALPYSVLFVIIVIASKVRRNALFERLRNEIEKHEQKNTDKQKRDRK